MKDKFFVITAADKDILYIPANRLLRLQAIPGHSTITIPTIGLYFEGGFSVILRFTREGNAAQAAGALYEMLVNTEEDIFLRPGEDAIDDIACQRDAHREL